MQKQAGPNLCSHPGNMGEKQRGKNARDYFFISNIFRLIAGKLYFLIKCLNNALTKAKWKKTITGWYFALRRTTLRFLLPKLYRPRVQNICIVFTPTACSKNPFTKKCSVAVIKNIFFRSGIKSTVCSVKKQYSRLLTQNKIKSSRLLDQELFV